MKEDKWVKEGNERVLLFKLNSAFFAIPSHMLLSSNNEWKEAQKKEIKEENRASLHYGRFFHYVFFINWKIAISCLEIAGNGDFRPEIAIARECTKV